MPRWSISGVAVSLAIVLTLLWSAGSTAYAAAGDAPASFDEGSVFVYVPPSVQTGGRPAKVVFALHGMGGEGKGFCQGFLNAAERNGWVVVAPTFRYRNWKDPAIVAADDLALTRALADLLDSMPDRIGRPVESKAIVLGFSRGAQLAHRFAQTYPDRTSAAVVMSAGSYTIPSGTDAMGQPLPFPFGTGDLAARSGRTIDPKALGAIPFWVAVGANDNNPGDVPRQWDAFEGTTRLERAGSFVRWLKDAGAVATLTVFPGTGHEMSAPMVRGALEFLGRIADPAPAAAGPAGPLAAAPVTTPPKILTPRLTLIPFVI